MTKAEQVLANILDELSPEAVDRLLPALEQEIPAFAKEYTANRFEPVILLELSNNELQRLLVSIPFDRLVGMYYCMPSIIQTRLLQNVSNRVKTDILAASDTVPNTADYTWFVDFMRNRT